MASESHDDGGPPAPIYNIIPRVMSPQPHNHHHENDDTSLIISTIHEAEEETVSAAGKRSEDDIDDTNDGGVDGDHTSSSSSSQKETGTPGSSINNHINETTNDTLKSTKTQYHSNNSELVQPDTLIQTNNGGNKNNSTKETQSLLPPPPPTSSSSSSATTSLTPNHTTSVLPKRHSSNESFFQTTSNRRNSISSNTTTTTNASHQRDPPARERPKDNIWPERDSLSFTRSLVFYGTGSITEEHEKACKFIMEARNMRKKYHGSRGTIIKSTNTATTAAIHDHDDQKQEKKWKEILSSDEANVKFDFNKDGVIEIYIDQQDQGSNSIGTAGRNEKSLITVPSIDEFVKDYKRLEYICSNGAMRSFCFQRLQMLHSAFKMHVTANSIVENEEQSNLLGTDFYRTMKIDNHIHLAAAPSAKQFVNFVEDKLEKEGDTVVMENGQTLTEVFEAAGLSADHMTIDAFNVLADYSVYQRFDNFNSKYSPFRLGEVRRIFLKVDNIIQGRYFAELTKNVLARLEQSKGHNSAAEMRLSIYGMERGEWFNLAKWVLRDWKGQFPGPVLSTHNRWIIQVPRLWRIFCMKGNGMSKSFQEMLENLFCPIFEATLYPSKHPEIAELLKHIVGFDSVDDEGTLEAPSSCTRPSAWQSQQNPAYCWQLYYLWANIEVLNKIREAKGLNTFAFRPHAGETGDVMHLAATYMLANSINHGINLEHQVSLQYLYYLDQIGLSISPLSNNFLFKKINENPFPKLFKRGLNVTLSTDDPLLFHMSDDALLEEYSVARASFDLSMTDISEIARNSILQSGFEDDFKKKWLGEEYKRGITFCDEMKTHVPLIRAKFRGEHLALEHMLVNLIAAGKGEAVLKQMMIHFGHARNAHRNILFQHLPDVSFPEQNQL